MVSEVGRLGQGDCEFKSRLGYRKPNNIGNGELISQRTDRSSTPNTMWQEGRRFKVNSYPSGLGQPDMEDPVSKKDAFK